MEIKKERRATGPQHTEDVCIDLSHTFALFTDMLQPPANGPQMKSLLDLPAELRNVIYEYALVFERNIPPWDRPRHRKVEEWWQPALTRTNRMIRGETLPIFYALNTFSLHPVRPHADRYVRWLLGIGTTNRRSMLNCVGGLIYCGNGQRLKKAQIDKNFEAFCSTMGIPVHIETISDQPSGLRCQCGDDRVSWVRYRFDS